MSVPVISGNIPLSTKIFTAKMAIFILYSDPSALPDMLLQMVLNKVFIPLSMLMTSALNRIEINQNVKYKCLTYSPGIGKSFLDNAAFCSEDNLSDFEFSKAYTYWITLIEAISDPIVAGSLQAHHKHMISAREFLTWAQAWCMHNRLLCTRQALHLGYIQPHILEAV